MDRGGGCCIARYTGGSVYDMSKIDRIMLRYRPIAPRPSVSGSSAQKKDVFRKRSYAKTSNNRSNKSTKKRKKTPSPDKNDSNGKMVSSDCSVSGMESVVTLPLLPESPERKDSNSPSISERSLNFVKTPEKNWLNFGHQECNTYDARANFTVKQHLRFVGSWVRVESLNESWVGGCYDLGFTDAEKLRNLERAKFPGFISDGLNRVSWVNRAYREMIREDEGVVVVWLVMKEGVRLPEGTFSCRVRVVGCGKEKRSLILPCDVWRMEGGGYAWRLDTEAALSLGR